MGKNIIYDASIHYANQIPVLFFREKTVWKITVKNAELNDITSYSAAIDTDFNQGTEVMCRTVSGITASNNVVSVPVDANTARFYTVLGSQPQKRAFFQLKGFTSSGEIGLLVSFPVDARGLIDANIVTTLPEAPTEAGGTTDYEELENKPKIEGIELVGNKTASALGLAKASEIPAIPETFAWTAITGKPDFAAVATSGSYEDLSNKPTIPAIPETFAWTAITNKPNFATVATSGNYEDLSNKPTIPAIPETFAWTAITGKPNFATVATSGSYDDLSNKPTIPAIPETYAWTAITGKPDFAAVATSGSYDDLSNKPTILSDITVQVGAARNIKTLPDAAAYIKGFCTGTGVTVKLQLDAGSYSGAAFKGIYCNLEIEGTSSSATIITSQLSLTNCASVTLSKLKTSLIMCSGTKMSGSDLVVDVSGMAWSAAGITASGLSALSFTDLTITGNTTYIKGIYSQGGSIVMLYSGITVQDCSTGLYCDLNGFIYDSVSGTTLTGNAIDCSPVANTDGNFHSYICRI